MICDYMSSAVYCELYLHEKVVGFFIEPTGFAVVKKMVIWLVVSWKAALSSSGMLTVC